MAEIMWTWTPVAAFTFFYLPVFSDCFPLSTHVVTYFFVRLFSQPDHILLGGKVVPNAFGGVGGDIVYT